MNFHVILRAWGRTVHRGSADNARYAGMHQHNCWQLSMLEAGRLEVRLRDRVRMLEEMDLLLLPPQCEHALRFLPGGETSHLCIKFYLADAPPQLAAAPFFRLADRRTRSVYAMLRGAISEFMQDGRWEPVEWELPSGSLEGARFLEGMIAAILGGCVAAADNARAAELLFRVRERIRYWEGKPVSVTALARDFHYSPGHFAQLVRRESGETVKAIIDRERLAVIGRTLATSSRTIAELSGDFGFCDNIYFSHYFKRHTGLTPGEYRRKFRVADSAASPGGTVVRPIVPALWERDRPAVPAAFWEAMGRPAAGAFVPAVEKIAEADFPEGHAELLRQRSGADCRQRLLLLKPHRVTGSAPGALVPFYAPELSFGYDWETRKPLPAAGFPLYIARHLLSLGFIVVATESYAQNIAADIPARLGPRDLARWWNAAELLEQRHPAWSGIGKLLADTRLALDVLLAADAVDPERVLAIGHALGGKMALYAGCLDERIGAMVLSAPGIAWGDSNWDAPWYWGGRNGVLKSMGFDHRHLLAAAAPKPFLLLPWESDRESCAGAFAEVRRLYEFYGAGERGCYLDHGDGPDPGAATMQKVYEWVCRNFGLAAPPPDFMSPKVETADET